jgi:hypothetical protein
VTVIISSSTPTPTPATAAGRTTGVVIIIFLLLRRREEEFRDGQVPFNGLDEEDRAWDAVPRSEDVGYEGLWVERGGGVEGDDWVGFLFGMSFLRCGFGLRFRIVVGHLMVVAMGLGFLPRRGDD